MSKTTNKVIKFWQIYKRAADELNQLHIGRHEISVKDPTDATGGIRDMQSKLMAFRFLWCTASPYALHTIYCSVVAELRGKLHMTKVSANTLCDLGYIVTGLDCMAFVCNYTEGPKYPKDGLRDGSSMELPRVKWPRDVFVWTRENQRQMIGHLIEKFCSPQAQDQTPASAFRKAEKS